jgi:hypothetical protein
MHEEEHREENVHEGKQGGRNEPGYTAVLRAMVRLRSSKRRGPGN